MHVVANLVLLTTLPTHRNQNYGSNETFSRFRKLPWRALGGETSFICSRHMGKLWEGRDKNDCFILFPISV